MAIFNVLILCMCTSGFVFIAYDVYKAEGIEGLSIVFLLGLAFFWNIVYKLARR